ncbi:uncharacterized protein LOC127515129 isoform X1 [Ctenopharyngodon idella]|uniref:uncharacterized protein LOC127515129 isoform X1 n=2 Tax=Ctenopharyngodon idella TaxID=7959 RepID=UPI0022312D22|nr:uncharacterized protein LOC127515129 isoform X1 [Ctenopharyngodon idella]XP_051754362.1 uncharacterized protein LOC127515129 isoform X1 [Ctenopharyngodon idella]
MRGVAITTTYIYTDYILTQHTTGCTAFADNKGTSRKMAVNNTMDYLSNCTLQSKMNFSGDPFYECMDSYPGNILTATGLLMNTVLLLPVNCWILWLVRRTADVASSDFVILNQSVAEVINDVSFVIFVLGAFLNKKALILTAIFLCSTFLVGRPLFQTIFCVERYLAVVHPLVYLKYTKKHKIKLLLVVLVWLIILMVGLFIVDSYPKIPIWLGMGLYLAMLVVCSSCSVMILLVLKRPKPGGRGKGAYQLKRKAFLAVTVILITLVFGYGTVSCVIVLKDQLSYHTYCSVLGLSWWTFIPSAAVQPYLYLSKVHKVFFVLNFLKKLHKSLALFGNK